MGEGWATLTEVENLKIPHPDLAIEEKHAKSHFGYRDDLYCLFMRTVF
jgi:hypothetical protein